MGEQKPYGSYQQNELNRDTKAVREKGDDEKGSGIDCEWEVTIRNIRSVRDWKRKRR